MWQNPTMIMEDISSNICPCFSIKDVCKLLLYNTSSISKSVLSDLAKHREQDCVSILTKFFTILLLILLNSDLELLQIKKLQWTVLWVPFCHYNNRVEKITVKIKDNINHQDILTNKNSDKILTNKNSDKIIVHKTKAQIELISRFPYRQASYQKLLIKYNIDNLQIRRSKKYNGKKKIKQQTLRNQKANPTT